jgi:hypothetical protein
MGGYNTLAPHSQYNSSKPVIVETLTSKPLCNKKSPYKRIEMKQNKMEKYSNAMQGREKEGMNRQKKKRI